MCEDASLQPVPPEWRLDVIVFATYSLVSPQKHAKSFNVLPSCGITLTLGIHCCNLCARTPPPSIGTPSVQCPWVGDNLPSFGPTMILPLIWTSWLAVTHLCRTHMPTHMWDARVPPWLYPLSSSAPNIYWLNHPPGLLHRPLRPNLFKKGRKRTRMRTGRGLPRQADGAISADSENVQHISWFERTKTYRLRADGRSVVTHAWTME